MTKIVKPLGALNVPKLTTTTPHFTRTLSKNTMRPTDKHTTALNGQKIHRMMDRWSSNMIIIRLLKIVYTAINTFNSRSGKDEHLTQLLGSASSSRPSSNLNMTNSTSTRSTQSLCSLFRSKKKRHTVMRNKNLTKLHRNTMQT